MKDKQRRRRREGSGHGARAARAAGAAGQQGRQPGLHVLAWKAKKREQTVRSMSASLTRPADSKGPSKHGRVSGEGA